MPLRAVVHDMAWERARTIRLTLEILLPAGMTVARMVLEKFSVTILLLRTGGIRMPGIA
jgi:hypothetical protein